MWWLMTIFTMKWPNFEFGAYPLFKQTQYQMMLGWSSFQINRMWGIWIQTWISGWFLDDFFKWHVKMNKVDSTQWNEWTTHFFPDDCWISNLLDDELYKSWKPNVWMILGFPSYNLDGDQPSPATATISFPVVPWTRGAPFTARSK